MVTVNTKNLPSWACYVAPQPLSNNHYGDDKSKKMRMTLTRRNRNSEGKKKSSNTLEQTNGEIIQESLEFQQDLLKTRLYHLQSRRLDRLVHDFLAASSSQSKDADCVVGRSNGQSDSLGSIFQERYFSQEKAIGANSNDAPIGWTSEVKDANDRPPLLEDPSCIQSEEPTKEKQVNPLNENDNLDTTALPHQKNKEGNHQNETIGNGETARTLKEEERPSGADLVDSTTEPFQMDSKLPPTQSFLDGDVEEEKLGNEVTNALPSIPVRCDKPNEANRRKLLDKDMNAHPPEEKEKEGPSVASKNVNDIQDVQRESFMNRYRLFPTEQKSNCSNSSRLLLPVTIWSQTIAPLQHALDRHEWIQCFVRRQRELESNAAVVWLPDNFHEYIGGGGRNTSQDWPKEEIIRQLWAVWTPSVHYSRRRWTRMSLSEMVQTWARHYPKNNHCRYKDHGDGSSTTEIQIVWDPQSCRIHSQFWTWLVELRCRYGVPLSVMLLEDVAGARILHNHQPPQVSTTLPHSCAAHIHILAAQTETTWHDNSSVSWLDRLVMFGLKQLREASATTGKEDKALRVVLHWLLLRREQKRRYSQTSSSRFSVDQVNEYELIPVLLHWKKEWACELARISLGFGIGNDDEFWLTVAKNALDVAPPNARADLVQRAQYVDLLHRQVRPKRLQAKARKAKQQRWQDYMSQRSISWLAFRLKYYLEDHLPMTMSSSAPASNWNEGHRRQILSWLLRERQVYQQQQHKQQPTETKNGNTANVSGSHINQKVLDCIHEWMILVDHCSSLAEFQECVNDRTLLSGELSCARESVDIATQVRRQALESLVTWNQELNELPESLSSYVLSSTKKDGSKHGTNKNGSWSTWRQRRQTLLSAWVMHVAPAALFQTLLTRTSVTQSDWFHDFRQRILNKVAHIMIHPVDDGTSDDDDDANDVDDSMITWLSPIFQYGIHHLRLMGLIKKQRKGNEISYEKIALVFCGGD